MNFSNKTKYNLPRSNVTRKLSNGFTLIETLIAILLLMTSVVAIMVLVSRILITTRGQRLETTAQYLLQEGVEYLRNNRDSALNGGVPWSDYSRAGPGCPITVGFGVPSVCECIFLPGSTGMCTVDPLSDDIRLCPASGCPVIVQVESAGRTVLCTPGINCPGFSGVVKPTTFSRSIRMTPNSINPDELYVDVTVSWQDTGVVRQKTLRTSLFNW